MDYFGTVNFEQRAGRDFIKRLTGTGSVFAAITRVIENVTRDYDLRVAVATCELLGCGQGLKDCILVFSFLPFCQESKEANNINPINTR